MTDIKSFMSILIPLPMLISFMNFLIGGFLSLNAIDINPTLISGAIVFALVIGAFNILNNIVDINSDEISKPKRPLPSMKLTIRNALSYYVILTLLCLVLSFLLNLLVFISVVLVTVIAWLYSYYPKIKKIIILNTVFVAFTYVVLPLVTGWVFMPSSEAMPLALIFTISLLAFLLVVIKDITDVVADGLMGVKTIPVVYGIRKTGRMLKWLIILPYLFVIQLGVFGSFFWLSVIPLPICFYLMNYIEKKPNSKAGELYLVSAMILGILTEILLLASFLMS